MSRFTELQSAVREMIQASPGIPAGVQVIARVEKDLVNDIQSALAKLGLCIYVLPTLPLRAMRTETGLIFFESAEVRVRIIENPTLNKTGFDAWDVCEAVATTLQGSNPGDFLACPLGLASTPVDLVEDPDTRVMDLIFDAAFQLNS